jgi:serine-type D-Ala-D-Ala carboxypeptidase/endopeptidase (penicillin-binding protein 4)
MKICLFFLLCFVVNISFGQTVKEKLALAVRQLEADSQFRHAIIGFCVVDSKTGKLVYDHNAQTGLAPASTQKLFTSCAAFDLLGKEYRYKTELGYSGENKSGYFTGNFYLIGYGDPTLGSWRYKSTREELFFQNLLTAVKATGFTKTYKEELHSGFILVSSGFENDSYNDGWIWQDIGNYYGAMHNAINWRENQFDISFDPGKKVGNSIELKAFKPDYVYFDITRNNLLTGPKGSGDNAYVYLNRLDRFLTVKGTIPLGENDFTISAAHPAPSNYFSGFMHNYIHKYSKDSVVELLNNISWSNISGLPAERKIIYTYYSPPLDSINHWFLKKSINLYGEALIKTIAYEKTGFGSTEKGVELVKNFWNQHGIEKSAVNIIDGSGLSPQNRVTADALVKVLQYAKTRSWFSSFFNALPEFNGMKMKSGSISGARAYAGYHTARDGKEYTFSIIINNYDGASGEVVKKIYTLLDNLK